MGRKAIALYCALALALSWAIQIALLNLFGMESDAAPMFMLACMWSPTLLALGFIAVHKPARQGVLSGPGNPLYWPIGVAFAAAVAFGTLAVFLNMGWATMPWFDFAAGGVGVNGGPWVLGKGQQDWLFFAGNVAATAMWFAVLNLVAAAGEEFAWRGFLQGHLVRQFGITGAIVFLGLFWAAWHGPLMLQGYNQPENPLLGTFVLFPIELTAISFFFAWLTIRSGSFWPAALAHGAGNSIQEGVISNMQLAVPDVWTDFVVMVPTVAVGLICWKALERRRKSKPETRPAYA